MTSLQAQVSAVGRIHLVGAPRILVLDTWSLFSAEGLLPSSLARALDVLLQYEGMQLAMVAEEPAAVREALSDHSAVTVAASVGELALQGPAIAVLTVQPALPARVYAWYVGPDPARAPYHSTRLTGVRATEQILGLFCVALVQERAGIAFRAASEGKPLPSEEQFDETILDGISRTVSSHPDRVARLQRGSEPVTSRDMQAIVSAALPPILACQAPDGAVAAARRPHGSDDPNYWFFWQRDAGHAVMALAHLARADVDGETRASVRTFISKYVDFVQSLPARDDVGLDLLGISRFGMDGAPILSYGNPQKDGPAQTVLAVIAALGAGEPAYRTARPYLEYLCEHMDGPSFDPWEFAVGDIFFCLYLGRRALRAGARLAQLCGDRATTDRYYAAADSIEGRLRSFLSPEDGYILAGRNYLQPALHAAAHVDAGVIGSILTACDVSDPFLNVDEPIVNSTVKALERVFGERWPVNVAWQREGNAGMGMGRFPEDANDGVGSGGGNPWTFVTLWMSQYYLRLIQRRDFLHAEDPGGQKRRELLEKADGYLRFVLDHVPPHSMTEQIDGQTGQPRGARCLIWAQAALIETLLLRREVVGGEFT